ncbi:hypothetical protein [Nocardiopsis chromatogenes]|uniref:hypothetical protein n=1 Tax=Nocardiopsis chromatogenes TaxID=280239 RepID=UPI000348C199|nr:hypothetical protein [Nocardiopsis chromatogenes]
MTADAATAAVGLRRRDLFAAEVTKIVTHPVTWLAIAATLVLNTGLDAAAATDAVRIGAGDGAVALSELGGVLMAPVYVFVLVAVFAAGSEYHNGQLRVTFTAVPDRLRLYAAKLAALLAVTVPAAVAVVTPGRLALLLGEASTPDIAVELLRWYAVYVVLPVIGFGLAIVTRNVVAPPTLLVLAPVLVATGVFQVPEVIRLLPHEASLSLVGTPAYSVTELHPGAAAAVLAGWGVLAAAAGGYCLFRRDA